ncbi:hypothetical protein [Halalkalibacillus halophilus]|uniref:hypothetical protein n=1 Tax=Halalkalibacillus halophilus TaxID=392827 RepID=UPI000422C078|nr:hypothetical protein [Halalkalibacillus halophilus]
MRRYIVFALLFFVTYIVLNIGSGLVLTWLHVPSSEVSVQGSETTMTRDFNLGSIIMLVVSLIIASVLSRIVESKVSKRKSA